MKAILLLFLFVSTSLALVQIPVQQHTAHKNDLKANQLKKLEKLNVTKVVRPNRGVKLIEFQHITDYISANVSFGTPPQKFNVLLTSGSPRAWLFSEETSNVLSPNINTYSPDESTTSKNLSQKFEQQTGSFDVLGTFFSDTFQIGDVKVKDQAFGLVKAYSAPSGADFPVDGVLGLNHLAKSVYTSGKEPAAPVDNVLKALNHIVVNFYLDKLKPPSQGPSSGLITIGGVDTEHCDYSTVQSLILSPSTSDDRLTFNVSELKYGSKKFGGGGSAFIDIAVSDVLVPMEALQNLVNEIQPDYSYDLGVYTVPCNATLKPLYFKQKNGATIHIAPEHLVVDIDLNNGFCALVIGFDYNNPDYDEDYILGAPAARSACLSYDFNVDQINVYPLKPEENLFTAIKHRAVKIYNDAKDWIKKTFSSTK